MENQNDEQFEVLHENVSRLRDIVNASHQEVQSHNEWLDSMRDGFGRADTALGMYVCIYVCNLHRNILFPLSFCHLLELNLSIFHSMNNTIGAKRFIFFCIRL